MARGNRPAERYNRKIRKIDGVFAPPMPSLTAATVPTGSACRGSRRMWLSW